MTSIKEHVGNIKNGIPSSFTSHGYDDEVHTFQDPNFYDYIKLANFTKKTGIELDGFHSFAFKELVDNAADFLETCYKESSLTIRVYISNDIATGLFRIAVTNPNDKDIQIFPISNLKKTFNYLGAFSSESNQYRITRGAQGVAVKQLAMLSYLQHGKNWNEPIVFEHNGRVDKVCVVVDRKHGKIIPQNIFVR